MAWDQFAAEVSGIAFLAAAVRGFGITLEPLPGTRLNMVPHLQAKPSRWLETSPVRPSVQRQPSWIKEEGEQSSSL